jgi:hypothetical protein
MPGRADLGKGLFLFDLHVCFSVVFSFCIG